MKPEPEAEKKRSGKGVVVFKKAGMASVKGDLHLAEDNSSISVSNSHGSTLYPMDMVKTIEWR